MFKVEDERHAEPQAGEFPSLAAVAGELGRLAQLPWDKSPNVAPCKSWTTCGRTYEIVEYDNTTQPWRELRRLPALKIDAQGARWIAPEIERLSTQ